MTDRPFVGVGVMVMKDGKLLLGKRKSSHGTGTYAGPGGHLEYMESFEDCARREVREECGIEITNVCFELVANMIEYAPKNFVHVGLVADYASGELRNMEPDKCEGWDWYDLDNLPQPSFWTTAMHLEAIKTGKTFFDTQPS